MEKKSLIKYLSLMGLTLVGTSCEKQENLFETSGNCPTPLTSTQPTKVGFTPIMELSLPDSINNHVIALSMLAYDVFDNPTMAESFSLDPQGYLQSKGLRDCIIDLNSVEVKAILALGDSEIKRAIESNDLDGFLRLLESKKYISVNTNYYSSMTRYICSQVKENKAILGDLPEINEKSPVWLAALVFVAAVAVYVWFVIDMAVEVACTQSADRGTFDNPVLKIWGLKNNINDIPVVDKIIEQNLDKVVDMVEKTDAYQQSDIKMKHEDLKNWLRKPVTQYFIDAGLI